MGVIAYGICVSRHSSGKHEEKSLQGTHRDLIMMKKESELTSVGGIRGTLNTPMHSWGLRLGYILMQRRIIIIDWGLCEK